MTTIAGTGFTVSHPSVGTYVVRYRKGSFPSTGHSVINVTPGTVSGIVVVPSISAVAASDGGLTATIVLSSTAGQLTPANEDFGFTILEV